MLIARHQMSGLRELRDSECHVFALRNTRNRLPRVVVIFSEHTHIFGSTFQLLRACSMTFCDMWNLTVSSSIIMNRRAGGGGGGILKVVVYRFGTDEIFFGGDGIMAEIPQYEYSCGTYNEKRTTK